MMLTLGMHAHACVRSSSSGGQLRCRRWTAACSCVWFRSRHAVCKTFLWGHARRPSDCSTRCSPGEACPGAVPPAGRQGCRPRRWGLAPQYSQILAPSHFCWLIMTCFSCGVAAVGGPGPGRREKQSTSMARGEVGSHVLALQQRGLSPGVDAVEPQRLCFATLK